MAQEQLAELEQEMQVLQRDLQHVRPIHSLIEKMRTPVDTTWGIPAPRFAGVVTSVNGYSCTLDVRENRFGKGVAAVVAEAPFRVAIYDDSGFKAEAIAVFIDPETGGVVCRLMFTKGEADIVKGDLASGL